MRRVRDGIRVIGGGGEFSAKLTLEVTGASKPALEAIEKAGGSITVSRPAKEKAAAEA